MTILITGAAGYIGSRFAAAWSHEPVIGLDIHPRDGGHSFDLINPDPGAFAKLILQIGPSAIIHLATAGHTADADANPSDLIALNVKMTEAVFRGAQHMRGCHIIIAGSATEYGDLAPLTKPADECSPLKPTNAYALSKVATSMMAMGYGRGFNPVTVLRFANVYGPDQPADKFIPIMIRDLVSGKKIALNSKGRPSRNYVYIDDVCSAISKTLIGKHTGIFNIADKIEVLNIDVAHMVVTELQGELPDCFNLPFEEYVDLRETGGGSMRVAMDNALAMKVLGWKPTVWMPEGIHRTVRAYLKESNVDHRKT